MVVDPLKHFRVSVAPPSRHSLPSCHLMQASSFWFSYGQEGHILHIKYSADLEIVTQADVQLSVISFLQVNDICI